MPFSLSWCYLAFLLTTSSEVVSHKESWIRLINKCMGERFLIYV